MLTPILMYHEVAESDALHPDVAASWAVSPRQFSEHLAALAEAGFTGVSVARWLDMRSDPGAGVRPVVITFDDGYVGNVRHAVPALQERGWTATFFVISGKMGIEPYALPEDWRTLAEAGMDVASHTATHPFTGALPPEAVHRELLDSRLALEEAVGRPVAGLSWPNGDAPRCGRAMLTECGYKWAATSRPAFATPVSDALTLPRLPVRSWHNAETVLRLVDSGLANRIRLGAAGRAKSLARTLLGRKRYASLQTRMMGDET